MARDDGLDERLIQLSKTLAYVLRHRPDTISIELGPGGWVDLPVLLEALGRSGHPVDEGDIRRVVAGGAKRRYELVDGRIRAMQGHSVDVDLGLTPEEPPPVLFHGTVERFLESIRGEGLRPGSRTHVHLSVDRETAEVVGRRRGQAIILEVDAAGMYGAGHPFWLAANGVWLVERVPPDYLTDPRDQEND